MYFKAIQSAKRVHWYQFLADVDLWSVWDARKIAAGRVPDRFPTLENASSPTEINNTLLQHFFPPRPSPPPPLILSAFKDIPSVLPSEVSSALQKSSNISAPGPSSIPYSIWKRVYTANERLLPSLFTPLLTHRYHPQAMKKADGIVLDKPGNPDYVHQLLFPSLSYLKPSPRSSRDFLLFVSCQPPTPLASYTPISVGLWPVWAVSTLLLPSPTKCAYSKLLPSKYQLSFWMSKVVLTMSVQTSWLVSSPKEGSLPIWLPGLSLSSPDASADSSSKACQGSFARSLLAPLRAL